MLPDRHRGLQLVDQRAAGVEGLGPVRARHGDDHGQIADLQVSDPVHRGDRRDTELGRDMLGDPAQLGLGGGMRAVGKGADLLVVVFVPDRAGKDDDAAGRGVGHGGADLVDRQRGLPYPDQPNNVHASKGTASV